MATARPFAYNPGPSIPGTSQVGDLSIGFPTSGFTSNPKYWNGPNEQLGYVIAKPVSGNTQSTQVPKDAITLSSTYKGTDVNLSNNNQTATQQFGYQQSVLGETIISGTNKVMFSVLCNLLEPNTLVDSHFIGVGTTSMNYQGNPYGGYPGNDTQSIGFNAIGQYYYNGSVVASGLPTWTDGDTIDIAISHGQYWWIRVNGGNWNNNPSADPTTLTNGLTTTGLTNYYPTLCPAYQGIMTVLNYPKYGVPSDYNFLGNVSASVGFFRSPLLTENSFVQYTNSIFSQNFTGGTDAATWLNANGYWTSYGLTPSIVTDNLQLYLTAGDTDSYPGSGTSWFDLSPNSYTSTLINGVGFSSASGGTLTFNGVNQYVDTNNLINAESFSVSSWFRTSAGGIKMIISKETNAGWPWNYRIWLNGGTIVGDVAQTGGVSTSISSPLSTYNNGGWYNVVFTRNDSTLKLYVNGVQIATAADTLTGTISNNQEVWIGQSAYLGGSYDYTGDISEIMVYNAVLTDAEVLQNFDATKSRFGF